MHISVQCSRRMHLSIQCSRRMRLSVQCSKGCTTCGDLVGHLQDTLPYRKTNSFPSIYASIFYSINYHHVISFMLPKTIHNQTSSERFFQQFNLYLNITHLSSVNSIQFVNSTQFVNSKILGITIVVYIFHLKNI